MQMCLVYSIIKNNPVYFLQMATSGACFCNTFISKSIVLSSFRRRRSTVLVRPKDIAPPGRQRRWRVVSWLRAGTESGQVSERIGESSSGLIYNIKIFFARSSLFYLSKDMPKHLQRKMRNLKLFFIIARAEHYTAQHIFIFGKETYPFESCYREKKCR